MSSPSPSSSSNGFLIKSPRGTPLRYPPSPPLSRHSNDSDDSLRALELSDGPIGLAAPIGRRPRSYSISGFDFQQDLLPLSSSVSEPRIALSDGEKSIGLVNGVSSCGFSVSRLYTFPRNCPYRWITSMEFQFLFIRIT